MSDSPSAPDRWIARHIRGLPRSGIRDFFELVQGVPDVISLGIGEPDYSAPWRAREAAIYALEHGRTNYTSNLGQPRLRRAIARYLREQHGLLYDPESEILVTVGVSEALDLVLRAILDPGDEVIIHEPCYVSYSPSVRLAHALPVVVPTRAEHGFRLDPDEVARAITPRTKALLVNFPCNPTGAVISPEDAAALARVVAERDLLLLADEIYCRLCYDVPFVSLAAQPGLRERTVYLNGMSKAWAMTGLRLGFACAPHALIEAMMRVHQYAIMCASTISQEAAITSLSACDREVEQMRTDYHRRRNYLHARLLEAGLACTLPQGAFYLFPDIRATGLTSEEFAKRLLLEERVAVVPGSAFGPSGQGFVRCCYATSMEQLRAAADRIARFVARIQPRPSPGYCPSAVGSMM